MFSPVEHLRIVYDENMIRTRVRELAKEIDSLYGDEPLVIVCVLKGAFLFFSDLVRGAYDFSRAGFRTSGQLWGGYEKWGTVSFTKDIELSLEGKHVLIVEDIIDSGRSMDFLLRQLSARGAKSLKIAALIDKKERREVPVHADFVGFA